MRGLPGAELLRGDRLGERASGIDIGNEHCSVLSENRSGLGHEMHAAEDDDLMLAGGSLTRERKGVTGAICHILDLRALVVVGKDEGIALARQHAHLLLQRRDLPEAGRRLDWN